MRTISKGQAELYIQQVAMYLAQTAQTEQFLIPEGVEITETEVTLVARAFAKQILESAGCEHRSLCPYCQNEYRDSYRGAWGKLPESVMDDWRRRVKDLLTDDLS